MGEVDGLGSDGGEETTMAKGPAAWAPREWIQGTVGGMLRGEGGETGTSSVGKEGPGEKESRRGTTSEAQGSRSRTSGGGGGAEPTATEVQEAFTQGTVGVMLHGEEGDVGAGCGGVQEPGENESP